MGHGSVSPLSHGVPMVSPLYASTRAATKPWRDANRVWRCNVPGLTHVLRSIAPNANLLDLRPQMKESNQDMDFTEEPIQSVAIRPLNVSSGQYSIESQGSIFRAA